ncbi:MAG TPA: hypothetical protein VI566_04855 [Xanthomonadales bacterium]|nr:hypothetical protein [Xanthomonadales bacterium]
MNTQPHLAAVTARWQELAGRRPATALQQSGLAERHYHSACIDLRELDCTTLLRLHSLLPAATLEAALAPGNIPLPGEVNQSIGQDPSVLCLAPAEWLVFSEFQDFNHLAGSLGPAIEPRHTALLDLSAAFTVFRLSGSGAPWLLNKLCGLDIQRDWTGGAHCARTRLQHTGVVLHQHRPGGQSSENVLDLILDRSLALYTWKLLLASIPHAEQLTQTHGVP